MNFKKFLNSKKNLIGCGLATIGLILYLVGFISSFWYLISAGLYIMGYILGPNEKEEITFYETQQDSFDDYKGFIKRLLDKTQNQMPLEANDTLNQIKESSYELLDYLIKNEKDVSYSENISVVKQIFSQYLPNIINQYVKLPRKYAENVKINEGKTAKELFLEQLEILHKEIIEVSYGIYENDSQKLIAHNHFLKEKFEPKTMFTSL
jgi:hypothetical protein